MASIVIVSRYETLIQDLLYLKPSGSKASTGGLFHAIPHLAMAREPSFEEERVF